MKDCVRKELVRTVKTEARQISEPQKSRLIDIEKLELRIGAKAKRETRHIG